MSEYQTGRAPQSDPMLHCYFDVMVKEPLLNDQLNHKLKDKQNTCGFGPTRDPMFESNGCGQTTPASQTVASNGALGIRIDSVAHVVTRIVTRRRKAKTTPRTRMHTSFEHERSATLSW
jgi:hypothetical protein